MNNLLKFGGVLWVTCGALLTLSSIFGDPKDNQTTINAALIFLGFGITWLQLGGGR